MRVFFNEHESTGGPVSSVTVINKSIALRLVGLSIYDSIVKSLANSKTQPIRVKLDSFASIDFMED